MIFRTFHPIGQGACYSENIENFNIVYDCGTLYLNEGIKNTVKQSFQKEIINILFISHFDFDHISLIKDLISAASRIERVIIPLLEENDKIFLFNLYNLLGMEDLATLVSNPDHFFKETTTITYVDPDMEANSDQESFMDLDKLPERISNGTTISSANLINWGFIPYNYKCSSRREEFLDNLREKGIDAEKLFKKEGSFSDDDIKAVKNVYKNISGNINENSMFLYSGPIRNENNFYISHTFGNIPFNCWYSYPYFDELCFATHNKVACLYTGDGNLNKAKAIPNYTKLEKFIGTIQIPHHGSMHSFAADTVNKGSFFCPISVGKNNPYGHPSWKVIRDILLRRSYPILITEDLNSRFTQIILRVAEK